MWAKAMRNRSSIFSSSTVKSIPKAKGTLIVSLVLIVCALAMGARLLYPFMRMNNSRIGTVLRYLEGRLADEGAEYDLVVFFGSSRFQTAIDLERLDEVSGSDGVVFLNLSQPSMGPWHYAKVFGHVRGSLARVRVVVFEVSPWMFNRNALHPIKGGPLKLHDEVDKWGTFRERMEIGGTAGRLKAVAFGVIPRYPLSEWVKAVRGLAPVNELTIPAYRRDERLADTLRVDPVFKAENISVAHLSNFEFDDSEAQTLEQLVEKLSSGGARVFVVHPPVRAAYYDYLDRTEGAPAEFRRYKEFFESLSEKCGVLYWDTPADCGFDESIFLDYGHMTREGAAAFTSLVYSEIEGTIERAAAAGSR